MCADSTEETAQAQLLREGNEWCYQDDDGKKEGRNSERDEQPGGDFAVDVHFYATAEGGYEKSYLREEDQGSDDDRTLDGFREVHCVREEGNSERHVGVPVHEDYRCHEESLACRVYCAHE